MRLFLILLIACVGVPALILGLTRLSYVLVPASIEAAIKRACVWTLARVLHVTERSIAWLAFRLPGREVRASVWEFSQRVRPSRWCALARSLHEVCDFHAESAPAWWDFLVDCAGHDCGACEACECKAGKCHHHLCHTRPERVDA
ncbi:MAG: hypothetical protein HOV97_05450 [Nonomuraea sp.]|nr:hypothetical protein [Nonomuraea sp.]